MRKDRRDPTAPDDRSLLRPAPADPGDTGVEPLTPARKDHGRGRAAEAAADTEGRASLAPQVRGIPLRG
ncbi:Helix-turn-helix transcriptional regulator OS=Streptomyces tendae OX=1932 GN=GUR47_12275 PE=4 SV=1 [Streptomyces tendae]